MQLYGEYDGDGYDGDGDDGEHGNNGSDDESVPISAKRMGKLKRLRAGCLHVGRLHVGCLSVGRLHVERPDHVESRPRSEVVLLPRHVTPNALVMRTKSQWWEKGEET